MKTAEYIKPKPMGVFTFLAWYWLFATIILAVTKPFFGVLASDILGLFGAFWLTDRKNKKRIADYKEWEGEQKVVKKPHKRP